MGVLGGALYFTVPIVITSDHYNLYCIGVGLGSLALIFAIMAHASVRTAMCSAPIHALGRASFSLYLIHTPILVVLASRMSATISVVWIALATLAVAIPLALLMAEVIEQPLIRLGASLARSAPAVTLRIPKFLPAADVVQTGKKGQIE